MFRKALLPMPGSGRMRRGLTASVAMAVLTNPVLVVVGLAVHGSGSDPNAAPQSVAASPVASWKRVTTRTQGRRQPKPSPSPSSSTGPALIVAPATSPTASASPSPSASAPVPTAVSPDTAVRGVDPQWVPVADVTVSPGELTQAMLDGRAAGTRFALRAGIHRLAAPLTLRAGQQLLGNPGAVVSGARVLSGWVADGSAWRLDGQTLRLPPKPGGDAPCAPTETLCNAAEDVFLDDAPLRQVATRAALVPGSFYFDYAASRIYIADNPVGRTLETTAVVRAVTAPDGGTLRNLVVEKFGNPAQSGAIAGNRVHVVDSVVRLNHGVGIMTYGGSVMNSVITYNGQMGLGAGGDDMLVQNNEIAWNNVASYDAGWEAGGTKWAFTNRLVVRANWSHDNFGNGLWTDIDNDASTYEGNLSERNEGIGIFHEISYSARIVGNTVRNNGVRAGYFSSRVGINVTNSSNVEVSGNTVSGNGGGAILVVQDTRAGSGRLGPHVLSQVTVHHNVQVSSAGYQGLWVYDAVPDRASYFSSSPVTFSYNSYKLGSLSARAFLGGDALTGSSWDKTWTTWRSLGQDAGSTAVAG